MKPDFYQRFDVRKPVLVFGLKGLSELAAYVLSHDSPFRVAGYTVDAAYCSSEKMNGLPVFPFETLEEYFGPEDASLLIPLGYARINGLRMDRFQQARSRGYATVSYVSSRATVWPSLEVGDNSMIYENTVIQPYATVGNGCIIRSSVHISHHTQVGDHSFIAAGVVTGGQVTIGERCFVGLGSTLRDGVALAPRTFVGAGGLVLKDTEENGLYLGSPARLQVKRADEL